jgi:2-polyprenyl-3-methyl-5-hydroxy-6-metoxy-1,4-benzoquinol methylase
MQKICQVCGSNDWRDLPNPAPERSVTTAGRILDEALGKAQCPQCGFVQRVHAQFLGYTDYYQQDYANYYNRPGTTQFHTERYRVLVEWMASVLQPLQPTKILDVGCGQGWAMHAMKKIYPQAVIEGVEPSNYNTKVAIENGLKVYEGMFGDVSLPLAPYDLVYCNNVIQHVTNVREFVVSLKDAVSDDGIIIVTCPDGTVPNIEILWGDQNFSFLPAHLKQIFVDTGFKVISWFPSPSSPSVPPAQMFFLSENPKHAGGRDGMNVPIPDIDKIFDAKSKYLQAFQKIDEHICSQIGNASQVYNFGASYWSSVLAAYCPNYWSNVSGCLVDNTDSIERGFLDKQVIQINSIKLTEQDAIVLGTGPATHKALRERLSTSWKNIISWDDFIKY